jgi:DNA-directed RNA polymerase specialized sigma54-like protein
MSVLEQKQFLNTKQGMRQYLRIEQSNMLEMSQRELNSLIYEIEHSRLFDRLFREERIIRYSRFKKSDLSKNFYILEENLLADAQTPDIESLLLNKKRVVEYIRDIGLENFRAYFLLPEICMSDDEIAGQCGIKISQVKEIISLVDDIAIMDDLCSPSKCNTSDINYSKVASIERDRNGFIIAYCSIFLSRGRYTVDYEKFACMESSSGFSDEELKEAKGLLKKLEMVNRYKESLHQVLYKIIEKQAAYLDSGDKGAILPFSQKEMAENIGVAPSSVSRLIRYRTLETPQGIELPLKSFFPNPKKFKKELLKKVLETERDLFSDARIQKVLAEKYGVNISRRSVSDLRNELKIRPASK